MRWFFGVWYVVHLLHENADERRYSIHPQKYNEIFTLKVLCAPISHWINELLFPVRHIHLSHFKIIHNQLFRLSESS